MDYKLTEIFDIGELQLLCDSITKLNGTALGILDLEGNIHVASGFSTICSHVHRKNSETIKKCIESDTVLSIKTDKKYKIYKCHNGMVEESDRLKTAFLQNMSHEIRTPMNAII